MFYKIRFDYPTQNSSYYLDSIVPGGYKFTNGAVAENICRNLNDDLSLSSINMGKYTVEIAK